MADGALALARQYEFTTTGRIPFRRLREQLEGLLFSVETGTGLLVNNFATVNAAATQDSDTTEISRKPHNGRLYGLLMADNEEQLAALDTAIADTIREETTTHV